MGKKSKRATKMVKILVAKEGYLASKKLLGEET